MLDQWAPHDTEPDDERLAPHHYYTGLLLALTAGIVGTGGWTILAVLGALFGIFAFVTLWWELYATLGALMSLLAVVVVGVSGVIGIVVEPWYGLLAVVGAFVAGDDAVEHATGWTTPLEYVWQRSYHLVIE